MIKFLAFFIFGALTCFSPGASAATSLSSVEFSPGNFQGIDTIVVQLEQGAGSRSIPRSEGGSESFSTIPLVTVKEIFGEQPQTKVVAGMDDVRRPNVVVLTFFITVRDILLPDQSSVKVASLSLQFSQLGHDWSHRVFHFPAYSYPFLLSSNAAEMQKRLAEGVHFLADHFPSYFACANNYAKYACSALKDPHTAREKAGQ